MEYELFPQLIFFKHTIILWNYTIISSKAGKIHNIPWQSSKILKRTAFKFSLNWKTITFNWQWEIATVTKKLSSITIKSVILLVTDSFRKTEGGRLLPLGFFLTGFLNFGRESSHTWNSSPVIVLYRTLYVQNMQLFLGHIFKVGYYLTTDF